MYDISIRKAELKDADRLLQIYSYYVENTAISFECEVPSSEEFRKRIACTVEKYPFIVLVADGMIQGYAYAGAFVGRAAYSYSCEVTIYLDHNSRRRGYGRLLYERLEKELGNMGIRNLYACIGDPIVEDEYLNKNSEKFHQHLGFTKVGTFHKCGNKFGRWYNMIWMEKMIVGSKS